MSLNVVFFQRKPRSSGNFSIEILFDRIREKLPVYIKASVVTSTYESNGIWKRLYNIFEAYLYEGDVNHITGDVHFLTYLLKKQKTILTIHDCGFMNHSSALARFILKFFWLTIPVHKSSVITVVSQATKNELLNYVTCDPEKIKVIPNCISPQFKPYPKRFNTLKPVLLQIGTAPNKNLNRIIEAIKDIPCHLEIIGKLSIKNFSQLKEYNIHYSNSYNISEEEIIEKYKQCDILTFVSTYEGFGMPIIEAQTIERPVVTSNISSMPEVAGEGACFVNPYDVNSIRQGIIQVIADDQYRKHLIEKGRKNRSRFSADEISKQYTQIYERINSIPGRH